MGEGCCEMGIGDIIIWSMLQDNNELGDAGVAVVAQGLANLEKLEELWMVLGLERKDGGRGCY